MHDEKKFLNWDRMHDSDTRNQSMAKILEHPQNFLFVFIFTKKIDFQKFFPLSPLRFHKFPTDYTPQEQTDDI